MNFNCIFYHEIHDSVTRSIQVRDKHLTDCCGMNMLCGDAFLGYIIIWSWDYIAARRGIGGGLTTHCSHTISRGKGIVYNILSTF